MADVVEQVKQGQLAVLATFGQEENPLLPGAPTLKSKGIDLVMGSYRALAAPADTPPEVLNKLREALKYAAEDPEYIRKSEEVQQPIYYLNAEEFSQVLKNDMARLEKLWEDLDLPSGQ